MHLASNPWFFIEMLGMPEDRFPHKILAAFPEGRCAMVHPRESRGKQQQKLSLQWMKAAEVVHDKDAWRCLVESIGDTTRERGIKC